MATGRRKTLTLQTASISKKIKARILFDSSRLVTVERRNVVAHEAKKSRIPEGKQNKLKGAR
jgi:hypothetical protein